jgi:hypothetical protein
VVGGEGGGRQHPVVSLAEGTGNSGDWGTSSYPLTGEGIESDRW